MHRYGRDSVDYVAPSITVAAILRAMARRIHPYGSNGLRHASLWQRSTLAVDYVPVARHHFGSDSTAGLWQAACIPVYRYGSSAMFKAVHV